jgi:cation:H+ antiporter
MQTALASIVDIILFFTALFFVIKSADIFLISLQKLARSNHVQIFALSGLVAAVGTSLPELFVGVTSALAGKSDFILGVVIGSNITMISLVIGLSTLIGGGLAFVGDFVGKDFFKTFLISLAPFVLLFDGNLSKIDGLILLLIFLLYHYSTFHEKRHRFRKNRFNLLKAIKEFLAKFTRLSTRKQLIWGGIGIIMLIVSSEVLVQISIVITRDFNLPIWFVGMVFIGLGTSLPELVLQIKAGRKEQTGIVFGNLFGSLIANATLVLGISTLIYPIEITNFAPFLRAGIFFILSFGLLWFFVRTKYKLQRWEGLVLSIIYILFLIGELTSSSQYTSSAFFIH